VQRPSTIDPHPHASGKWVAVLLGGAVAICLAPILLRYAAERGVGPVAAAFWRAALALPVMGGAVWVRSRRAKAGLSERAPAAPDRRAVLFAVLGGVCFGLDLMFYYLGLMRTTVANATLLSNCAPVFVAIAAWVIFGERFGWLFVVGLALAIGGAATLSLAERAMDRQGLPMGQGQSVTGDVLAAVSAVFYAGYQLLIKRARRSLTMPKTFALSLTASACVLGTAALILGESFVPRSDPMRVLVEGWLVLLALGLVVQLGGQGSIVAALRHLPVSLSTVVLLAQPVSVAGLGWLLFGESMGPWHMAGGAAVLVGIYLARRGTPSAAAANARNQST